MGAKVYADCLSLEPGSGPETASRDGAASGPPSHAGSQARPGPQAPTEPLTDGELEVEVQTIAAWFESLPDEWRSYFDREAQTGRRAYVLA